MHAFALLKIAHTHGVSPYLYIHAVCINQVTYTFHSILCTTLSGQHHTTYHCQYQQSISDSLILCLDTGQAPCYLADPLKEKVRDADIVTRESIAQQGTATSTTQCVHLCSFKNTRCITSVLVVICFTLMPCQQY